MKQEPLKPSRIFWLRGLGKVILDMLLGTAVMLLIAFLLWLWKPELLSFNVFWGEETTRFGLYNNVLKTAASIFLFLTLFALYNADFLKKLPATYAYFGYTEGVKAEIAQNKADFSRIMHTYVAMIGGSVLPLILAFFIFPWLSQHSLLPNSWTVSSEPLSLISEDRILVTVEDPVVSTIENNLFRLEMKKEIEYLIILRPPQQNANLYALSFPVTGFSQGSLKVLDWASDGKKLDWRLVSNSKNIVVNFEVFYTGNGTPGEYKIYAFENIINNPDKVAVSPWHTGEIGALFPAEAEKVYAIAAWPIDPQYSTSIGVYNKDGRVQTTNFGSYMELILFQPSDTGQYEVRIEDPDDFDHEGYEMVVLTLD